MKDNIKKSEKISYKKKLRKDLEEKIQAAFIAITEEYGKTKKTKAIIEKFAKQLVKKIEADIKPKKEKVPKPEKKVNQKIITDNQAQKSTAQNQEEKKVVNKTSNK